jgi:hypothetical protein
MSPVRYELGFYIPEDDILHIYRLENLKSYIDTNVSKTPDVSLLRIVTSVITLKTNTMISLRTLATICQFFYLENRESSFCNSDACIQSCVCCVTSHKTDRISKSIWETRNLRAQETFPSLLTFQ